MLGQRAGKPISRRLCRGGRGRISPRRGAACASELAAGAGSGDQHRRRRTGERRKTGRRSAPAACWSVSRQREATIPAPAGRGHRPPAAAGEELSAGRRVRTLLAQRRAAYGAIPYQIDTEGRRPRQWPTLVDRGGAGDHAELPGMVRIPHCAERAYDICLGDGILAAAGRLLAQPGAASRRGGHRHQRHDPPEHAETLAASLPRPALTPTICISARRRAAQDAGDRGQPLRRSFSPRGWTAAAR
jgi:hypothetical protein